MIQTIISIIIAVLRVVIPAVIESSKSTSEDAARNPELKSRLRSRVRAAWGASALVLLALAAGGCVRGTRTIYIPPGSPVRLAQTIKSADVWILDKDKKPIRGNVDLSEGWWVLPDEEDDPELLHEKLSEVSSMKAVR